MKHVCEVCGWVYDEAEGYPEGGIAPEEKQRLDQIGAQSVTLGKRILRTETAGLCALAALWTALGEM